MKYYKVDVEMTNGFKYSYTCNARMLSGMKQASTCWWTKSIESQEISEKEHIEFNHATFELDPVKTTKPKVNKLENDKPKKPTKLDSDSTTSKGKGLTKTPKLSSLEAFFGDEDDDTTDRPSIPTAKKSRNTKTDTVKKVRARRST